MKKQEDSCSSDSSFEEHCDTNRQCSQKQVKTKKRVRFSKPEYLAEIDREMPVLTPAITVQVNEEETDSNRPMEPLSRECPKGVYLLKRVFDKNNAGSRNENGEREILVNTASSPLLSTSERRSGKRNTNRSSPTKRSSAKRTHGKRGLPQ